MNASTLFRLAKKSCQAWLDDYAPSMGAAISYYTAFSIAPLLVIVISIAGAVFGQDAVRGTIEGQISGLVGRDGALAIQSLIKSAREPTEGIIASTISLVLLGIGATTVFGEIQSALDRIWHVPEPAKPSGIWGLLRARFLSFGLILGLAFLLMASLTVSAAVAAAGTWLGALMPGWELMLMGINTLLSMSISCVLFAMIFKFMPSVPIAWRDVWVGAAVTAVLFEVGKVLIGLYVGKAGLSSTYAAAGAIAVVLIWVYYAAQIFLLGAEFTKVYAAEHGSHAAAPEALLDPVEPRKGGADANSALTPVTPLPVPARQAAPAAPLSTGALATTVALLAARVALSLWLERREKRDALRRRR
ncbi:YihY/virulence factor BrkB family protein [Acidovorax sp. SUPP2825]|uniref:YihY/virulence factor BrkB family protein n=1 Tax=Acidovorax sp. SUPP2825 TaxID=2920879 RepID=UPI0023DE41F5|nr:YihY/virulence factor BrkB family protein [Acidovorax sp. SUPP2825]GKS93540.1 YihY/virulence factor BrkB family protein [Acidovorax sp. SUPP2825]